MRKAEIRTAGGIVRRPALKLAVLLREPVSSGGVVLRNARDLRPIKILFVSSFLNKCHFLCFTGLGGYTLIITLSYGKTAQPTQAQTNIRDS